MLSTVMLILVHFMNLCLCAVSGAVFIIENGLQKTGCCLPVVLGGQGLEVTGSLLLAAVRARLDTAPQDASCLSGSARGCTRA